ncbi:MAG: plastocyanin/azurin family copper-binding protein [Candidatus Bathyarchaeia archaeon]
MSSNKPLPWKGVSIVALVIAILSLGAVAATTITTSPSMSDDAAARIQALSEQLQKTEGKLSSITGELATIREEVEHIESAQHEEEPSTDGNLQMTSKQAAMAAVHVAYIDVRSKLNQVDSALAQGNMEETHEAFEDLQVALAHVEWPQTVEHEVGELHEALEALHHPLEEGNVEEARVMFKDARAAFHDLRGAFYGRYLPSTMLAAPSFEIELATEIPAFVGPDGQKNPTIEVHAGDIVKITLVNGDGVEHDIVIDALGLHSSHVREKGESTVVIFTAEKAGAFEYYCSVPGHKEAGMVGQIIVGTASS